jgi:hypothetical protein
VGYRSHPGRSGARKRRQPLTWPVALGRFPRQARRAREGISHRSQQRSQAQVSELGARDERASRTRSRQPKLDVRLRAHRGRPQLQERPGSGFRPAPAVHVVPRGGPERSSVVARASGGRSRPDGRVSSEKGSTSGYGHTPWSTYAARSDPGSSAHVELHMCLHDRGTTARDPSPRGRAAHDCCP